MKALIFILFLLSVGADRRRLDILNSEIRSGTADDYLTKLAGTFENSMSTQEFNPETASENVLTIDGKQYGNLYKMESPYATELGFSTVGESKEFILGCFLSAPVPSDNQWYTYQLSTEPVPGRYMEILLSYTGTDRNYKLSGSAHAIARLKVNDGKLAITFPEVNLESEHGNIAVSANLMERMN